jgi:hypothetical protein
MRRIIIWAAGTIALVGLAIGYQAALPPGEGKGGEENPAVVQESPGAPSTDTPGQPRGGETNDQSGKPGETAK